jgi:group I intron endonuclease
MIKDSDKFYNLRERSGIYCFKSLVSGKLYIGQSKDLRKRILAHLINLRKNKDNCTILQRAWNKHGEKNFIIDILEFCDIKEIHKREIFYIKKLKSQKPFGYNISIGGKSPALGIKFTKKRRKEASERMMGNTNTRGQKRTKEQNIRSSFRQLGLPRQNKTNKKTSKYVGVYWDKFNKAWHSEIMVLKKKHSLKYHKTEISAALAYNDALIKYYKKDKDKLNKISTKEIISNKKINEKIEKDVLSKKSSQYTGVHLCGKYWIARISYKNKRIPLGCFKNERNAAKAYNKKALEIYGKDAKINNIKKEINI